MELQTNVVEKRTFELLKKLMNDDALKDYFLVGGTALALRMGHRKSIDIDMFTQNNIPVEDLNDYLRKKYGFIDRMKERNTLKGKINTVEVDFITYNYPLIKPLERTEENIRLASREDIIAMKLSAITNSGTRQKDYVDIAFLSKDFSFNQMLSFYASKFSDSNIMSVTRALTYYNDIDFSDEPVELTKPELFSWEKISQRLTMMVDKPNVKFTCYPILPLQNSN